MHTNKPNYDLSFPACLLLLCVAKRLWLKIVLAVARTMKIFATRAGQGCLRCIRLVVPHEGKNGLLKHGLAWAADLFKNHCRCLQTATGSACWVVLFLPWLQGQVQGHRRTIHPPTHLLHLPGLGQSRNQAPAWTTEKKINIPFLWNERSTHNSKGCQTTNRPSELLVNKCTKKACMNPKLLVFHFASGSTSSGEQRCLLKATRRRCELIRRKQMNKQFRM